MFFYVKNNSALLLRSAISRHSQTFFASLKVNSDLPVILDERELGDMSSSSASLTCVYPAFFINSLSFLELIPLTPLPLFPCNVVSVLMRFSDNKTVVG